MKRHYDVVRQIGVALLLAAGATGIRYLFNPEIGSRGPFLVYILAVAIAGQIEGTISGLIATACSMILMEHAAPSSDLYMHRVLAIFGIVGGALSVFGGWKKRADDERQRVQYNLQTAQEIANIGSWESDPGGKLWWSAETYKIFGLAAGAELSTSDFYEMVHPEDRAKVREAAQRAIETRTHFDMEHRIVRKSDGQVRFVHQRGKAPAGGSGRLIGSIQDVTETKEVLRALKIAHERLTLKHEVARMGTFEWLVPEGRVEWSPEMEKLYGLESTNPVRTLKEWKTHIHPEDAAEAVAALEEAPRQHPATFDHSFRILRPDGEVRWIHGRCRYEYDAEGNPVHVIGINFDITEVKHGEMAQKILGGLVHVCSSCRRIRDGQTDEWYSMEGYLRRHSTAKFSHGMCEDCGKQWYPESVKVSQT